MKRMQRHKRHFQLLELMVAAFILLICIAPAMRVFTSIYQSQQEIVRENQRDHLAHQVHAKVTELLYKRQLHIPAEAKSQAFDLGDPDLVKELKKYGYEVEATLLIVDSTKPRNENHPIRYLAQLVIKLKDVSHLAKRAAIEKTFENRDPRESFYDYIIYIDAGAKAEKKNEKNIGNEGQASTPPAGGTNPSSGTAPVSAPNAPQFSSVRVNRSVE